MQLLLYELMDSNTDISVAHAEILLVTGLRKGYAAGNRKFLLSVYLP
jgi:hypothetical protein